MTTKSFWQKIDNGTAQEIVPSVCMDPRSRYSNSLRAFLNEKWKLAHEADKPFSDQKARYYPIDTPLINQAVIDSLKQPRPRLLDQFK